MDRGRLNRGVEANCMKRVFLYREGCDIEPFRWIDVDGLDIGSSQTFNLRFGRNQESVSQKRGPKPRTVDTDYIHSNLELRQKDTLAHSSPIDHEVGAGQELTILYRFAPCGP